MRLYQINAPLETNAGASYAAALVKFEACMLTLAGGYSEFVARGNWRDDDGKDHPEPMQVYQFASKPETRTRLVGIAFARQDGGRSSCRVDRQDR